MVKIKNGELADKLAALRELGELDLSKIPVKLGYAVARNIGWVEEAYDKYIKHRNALALSFAPRDKDGNPIFDAETGAIKHEDDAARKAAILAINALGEEEVEIRVHRIPITAMEGLGVRMILLRVLDFMFDAGELEKEN